MHHPQMMQPMKLVEKVQKLKFNFLLNNIIVLYYYYCSNIAKKVIQTHFVNLSK